MVVTPPGRRLFPHLLAALSVLICWVLPGTPALSQQGPWGTVRGRITDSAGRGLNEICVDYDPQEGRTSQYSNPDGSWRLTLEPGDYIIQFTDCVYERGYFTEFYSAKQKDAYLYEDATRLHIEGNQEIKDIDLVLEVGGTIRGRITDPRGRPIEQICNGVSPKTDYGSHGGGSSDADGMYEMVALKAGRFKVFFQDCRSDASGLVSGELLEWYRDAPDESSALTLNIERGKTIVVNVVIGGRDPPLSSSARAASGGTRRADPLPSPTPSVSDTPTPTPTTSPTQIAAPPAERTSSKTPAFLGVLIASAAALGAVALLARRRRSG
jgi:hypothetical protein